MQIEIDDEKIRRVSNSADTQKLIISIEYIYILQFTSLFVNTIRIYSIILVYLVQIIFLK